MSQYVDRFIKQHKEYFARNGKIIESNEWNNTDAYNQRIEDFSEKVLQISNSNIEDKEAKIKEIQKDIKSFVDTSKKTKEALFKQENELTNSILGRLSAFITEASGDRHLPKTQKFIDDTVKIIQIHLSKCDMYLDYSLDILTQEAENAEEAEYKGQEIVFQDNVFNKKIEIQDKLGNLNVNNDSENLTIKFFKDQKATLPMLAVLPHYNIDIKIATEKLKIATEIEDNEFYIHKLKRDPKSIPQWNPKKHYWEQDEEVFNFWWCEWLKITRGFTVDGYFIHPWLYYHLNFYNTPMPSDNGEEISNPSLRDNEWYVAECLKKITNDKGRFDAGIFLYGGRRFGKSVIMSSVCDWKALTTDNISTAITSGSEGDLTELTHKIKTSMKHRTYAFQLPAQKAEWDGGTVELGLKLDASTLMEHSRHTIKNLASGAKSSTQKTAGGAPSIFLLEEVGKFTWKKAYLAAQPSFETMDGYKTIVILVGTGGEASLSTDAMEALSNPKKYKLLEMDWDLLEKTMPPGFEPPYKRRTFANFIPAQMSYKTGFKRIEKGLGEFLGIKSEYLNKIRIHQTDWENNTKVLLDARDALKGDSLLLQQECVQYPIDPEDCFLSAEKNIFPYEDARRHKDYLIETGKWDRRRNLFRDSNGRIRSETSTKELAEYPHKGGNIDCPFLIFEDIPEYKPSMYTYVAGGDFYKQESSDTDSLGTISIYKFPLFADDFGYKLVASYSARPDTYTEFYDNCLLLLEAYNAKIFPENEDLGGFQTYLEKKHLEDTYLVPHIDFNSTLEWSQNGRRKWGWTPAQSKQKLLGLFAQYCKEPITIIDEDTGEEREIKRIQTIDDIGLLTELINYKKDANFDRVTASLGAVGMLHFLEKNYIYPKRSNYQREEGYVPEKRKEQPKSFYTKPKRRSGFYGRQR